MIEPTPLIRGSQLPREEADLVKGLEDRINSFRAANQIKDDFYNAQNRIQHAGIAIPESIAAKLHAVSGWGGTTVDVLEERLDWQGWSLLNGAADDALGLTKIWDENNLDVESSLAHLDTLIFGCSFIRTTGAESGDEVLISAHSPMDTTGQWDPWGRRLVNALTVTTADAEGAQIGCLDLPGMQVTMERENSQAEWRVQRRYEHDLDEVLVQQLVNRPRGARTQGRSEITRNVRYIVEAAVRTVLGMEVNREFYSIPQLAILGRGADVFETATGEAANPWQVLAGYLLTLDASDDGTNPDIKQLTPSSPEPFLAMLRGWSQLLAAEAGIPVSYLGLMSDNPSSADAIRAGEARLVKRAERRQTQFGRTWREVGRQALLARDGRVPDDLAARLGVTWRDAATPTRAATADETAKYVGSGVLPPDSPVTWKRAGFTPAEQRQLAASVRQQGGTAALTAIAERAASKLADVATPGVEAVDQVQESDATGKPAQPTQA